MQKRLTFLCGICNKRNKKGHNKKDWPVERRALLIKQTNDDATVRAAAGGIERTSKGKKGEQRQN